MSDLGTGTLCMYGGLLVGVLLLLVMGLSNLIAAVRYFTGDRSEPASTNSLIGWGLSVLSYFLGPCGLVTILIAFVMSRSEKKKMMMGDASAWSALPISVTGSNTFSYFIFLVLVTASVLAGQFLS